MHTASTQSRRLAVCLRRSHSALYRFSVTGKSRPLSFMERVMVGSPQTYERASYAGRDDDEEEVEEEEGEVKVASKRSPGKASGSSRNDVTNSHFSSALDRTAGL